MSIEDVERVNHHGGWNGGGPVEAVVRVARIWWTPSPIAGWINTPNVLSTEPRKRMPENEVGWSRLGGVTRGPAGLACACLMALACSLQGLSAFSPSSPTLGQRRIWSSDPALSLPVHARDAVVLKERGEG